MFTQPAHKAIPVRLRGARKQLRARATEPEFRFWCAVRAHRFYGLGFRRQTVIAGFIVDFVCHEHRLVIEIDGDSHTFSEARDAVRTARLEAEGYRVVRFWNHDVMDNFDGVLERLAEVAGVGASSSSGASSAVPPSQPSPTRGEGRNASNSRPKIGRFR